MMKIIGVIALVGLVIGVYNQPAGQSGEQMVNSSLQSESDLGVATVAEVSDLLEGILANLPNAGEPQAPDPTPAAQP